jgi:hypothetical protein
MLIFVEYIDLVKRIKRGKIIVSIIGMKRLELGLELWMILVKKFVPSTLLFVNFAFMRVILIFNARERIVAL